MKKRRAVLVDSSDEEDVGTSDEVARVTLCAKKREAKIPRPMPAPATPSSAVNPKAVSATDIERRARGVIGEVSVRFPQHARTLRRVEVETSAQMASSGAKTVFDAASPQRPRCIRLSLPIFKVRENFDSSLRDVVLHEAAHCIAGRAAAHGMAWQTVCREIGGTAALGHNLSCDCEGGSGRTPTQRIGAPPAAKRRRSQGGSSSWSAASDAVISQLIRF